MEIVKDIKLKATVKERKFIEKKLDEAYKLFKNGKNWIKNSEEELHVDEEGNLTDEYDYCLIGALEHVGANEVIETVVAAAIDKDKLFEEYSDTTDIITNYNDSAKDFKDIKKVIEKAKTILKKGEI